MELYMSFDNGANWSKQAFNLFNLQDGQLYLGQNNVVYKVTKTDDGIINSEAYVDYITAPPQQ